MTQDYLQLATAILEGSESDNIDLQTRRDARDFAGVAAQIALAEELRKIRIVLDGEIHETRVAINNVHAALEAIAASIARLP